MPDTNTQVSHSSSEETSANLQIPITMLGLNNPNREITDRIERRIDRIEGRIDRIDERVSLIDVRLSRCEEKVDGIQTTTQQFESRVLGRINQFENDVKASFKNVEEALKPLDVIVEFLKPYIEQKMAEEQRAREQIATS